MWVEDYDDFILPGDAVAQCLSKLTELKELQLGSGRGCFGLEVDDTLEVLHACSRLQQLTCIRLLMHGVTSFELEELLPDLPAVKVCALPVNSNDGDMPDEENDHAELLETFGNIQFMAHPAVDGFGVFCCT